MGPKGCPITYYDTRATISQLRLGTAFDLFRILTYSFLGGTLHEAFFLVSARPHPGWRQRGTFVAFVPLNQTSRRSKPAVPLAGKFRLVDIPLSNCINSDICKIFVLTQFKQAITDMLLRSRLLVRDLSRRLLAKNVRTLSGVTGAVRQSLDEMRTAGHFG